MYLICILVGGEITSSRLRLTVLATQDRAASLATHSHHYVLAFTITLGVLYLVAALFRHKVPAQRLVRLGGDWPAALMPRLLGLITFLAGALLIFSGATPAVAARLHWLESWIPLPIVEVSHFFDNLAGVTLLILARGVERRLDAAYHMTIVMLIAGILLSLLRALDIEQAVTLACFLAIFIPSRKYFYRKTSLIEERFTTPWIVAILCVVVGSIALGIVSYADLHLSTEAFFRFANRAEESRFSTCDGWRHRRLIGLRHTAPDAAAPADHHPSHQSRSDRRARNRVALPRGECTTGVLR